MASVADASPIARVKALGTDENNGGGTGRRAGPHKDRFVSGRFDSSHSIEMG
jgi:hypothetical protein